MKKILVAEDEQTLREGIVTAFKDRGWQVTEAADGAEAMDMLQGGPELAGEPPMGDEYYTDHQGLRVGAGSGAARKGHIMGIRGRRARARCPIYDECCAAAIVFLQ